MHVCRRCTLRIRMPKSSKAADPAQLGAAPCKCACRPAYGRIVALAYRCSWKSRVGVLWDYSSIASFFGTGLRDRSSSHLRGGVHGLVVEVHGAAAAICIADVQLPGHKGILPPDVLPDVPGILLVYVLVPVRLCGSPPVCACAARSQLSHGAVEQDWIMSAILVMWHDHRHVMQSPLHQPRMNDTAQHSAELQKGPGMLQSSAVPQLAGLLMHVVCWRCGLTGNTTCIA